MEEVALGRDRNALYEMAKEKLINACKMPRKKGSMQKNLAEVNTKLDFLSYVYLVIGASKVEKGEGENGWIEMKRGLTYLLFSAKVRHSCLQFDNGYDEETNVFSSAIFDNNEALALCHLIAVGENEIALKYGSFLMKNYHKSGLGSDLFFYRNHFFPLALKLFNLWLGTAMPLKESISDPFGPYAVGVRVCESDENAKDGLLEMCELHCMGTQENSDWGDFIAHPYHVFPVEILTILKIREKCGFSAVWPDHPLMNSRLSKPIQIKVKIEDEVVVAVKEKLARDCPNEVLNWI